MPFPKLQLQPLHKRGHLEKVYRKKVAGSQQSGNVLNMITLVKLEIDTGTYATVVSKKFHDDNFRDIEISESHCELRTYCGHSLNLSAN